jgi:hypothetical protein
MYQVFLLYLYFFCIFYDGYTGQTCMTGAGFTLLYWRFGAFAKENSAVLALRG